MVKPLTRVILCQVKTTYFKNYNNSIGCYPRTSMIRDYRGHAFVKTKVGKMYNIFSGTYNIYQRMAEINLILLIAFL